MNRIDYFKTSLFLSIFFHLLLIYLAFLVTVEPAHYISFSSVYRVSLVELPKAKGKPAKKREPNAKQKGGTVKPQVVSTSKRIPKKANSNIVKKNTTARKVVALKKSKTKKVKEGKESAIVEKKIEEIAKKVKEKIRREKLKQEVTQIAGEIKQGVSGGVIGEYIDHKPTGAKISPEFQMYYMDVWKKIKNS